MELLQKPHPAFMEVSYRGYEMDWESQGSTTYGLSLRWLRPIAGGIQHRSETAEGALPRERHRLAAGSCTMEGYLYGITVGIKTYGTQPSTSSTNVYEC